MPSRQPAILLFLPKGSSAVDFAYAVHSDLGNTCISVTVERKLLPLSVNLESGQTVKVHTSPQARPKPSWLNFVVTNKARNNIRHYLKNLHSEEAVLLGKRLLDAALSHFSSSLKEVGDKVLKAHCKKLKIENVDMLFEQIGLGRERC